MARSFAPVRRLSLRHKLMGLIGFVTTTTVLMVTVYFSTVAVRRMRAAQAARATMYAHLLSDQLRSAVAFGDRETAREVLGALERDTDVTGVALLDERGHPLFTYGAPSGWAGGGDPTALVVRDTDDEVAVAAPVVSLEGPRGVLAIELSMARIHAGQRALYATAAGIVALAISLGLGLSFWFIAGLRRRLAAMASVATAVTSGDLASRPIGDAHADEIGSLARAFDAMLAEVRDAHARLEVRVAERTAELAAANASLVGEMNLRTRAEVELRQAQKLESVGRLASGVAHEINTPLQFVSDSVHFLADAIGDMSASIDHYKGIALAAERGEPVGARVKAALAHEREVDLPFARESIPEAFERVRDGLTRVMTIVSSMKTFAHPDAAGFVHANLNAAIESTLAIARNEYKYVADVVTELAPLPPVECRVGEINQVVLNLVVNAAHAIADRVAGTPARGEIRITTRIVGDEVHIDVRDTGTGIAADIRDRVFDPFFTTKEVGKGTGQGLAIARGVVVDKHHGKLTFDTEPGTGTTFHIVLPVQQRER